VNIVTNYYTTGVNMQIWLVYLLYVEYLGFCRWGYRTISMWRHLYLKYYRLWYLWLKKLGDLKFGCFVSIWTTYQNLGEFYTIDIEKHTNLLPFSPQSYLQKNPNFSCMRMCTLKYVNTNSI